MNEQRSPAGFLKRSDLFMLGGIIVGGVIGYCLAGSEGREVGGGIGAGLGLIVGGLVGRMRK